MPLVMFLLFSRGKILVWKVIMNALLNLLFSIIEKKTRNIFINVTIYLNMWIGSQCSYIHRRNSIDSYGICRQAIKVQIIASQTTSHITSSNSFNISVPQFLHL